MRTALGSAFAGAWLADDGQWMVAVTAPVATDHVRGSGAQLQLATHSEAELAAAMSTLDQAEPPQATVTGWYVDVISNTVVVEILPEGQAAAAEFIEASGVDDALVRIVEVAEAPQLRQQYPLREGDPFFSSGRCSIGFLVFTATYQFGYVTAGHCASVGTSVQGYNMQAQGTTRASVFPGSDYALVTVNQNWIPTYRPLAGASTVSELPLAEPAAVADPPIGSTVCKMGSTTGLTCGIVQAKNQTVNYPQGSVYGLTRTNLCSEPGDSGAPVFTPDGQPYGIVVGGSGNCGTGGITFVQPLLPLLTALNLQLLWY